ncbi:hypothetical protein HG536_0B03790 [Torulaspora globosa]|uniref:Thioredoxin domain-containing protein n=1 Tax=Torulaspora globosa TaxID=48254 RepID=A0A7G3ZDD0_9SACH|nr:uncharacterized protein HG536_0B03790 [Torulaspora globosa]QLL31516.1 hypothetical protein HG536_0B03790 [Torulaspora globosa]
MLRFANGWGVVFLLLRVSALEFGSTGELYQELLRTECYTLVYVYAVGCHWCQRLDPQFDRLAALFGRDAVQFGRIEGRRSRNFSRDFNVESYPQLLLFAPGRPGDGLLPQDLLMGVYHGPMEFTAIAHYVGEQTGQMPEWPQARGNTLQLADGESLEKLYRQLNGRWRRALGLPLAPRSGLASSPVVLFFVSPWMGSRHRELFLQDPASNAIGQLGKQGGPSAQLWTVDCTREQWSGLVNEFRVSGAPKVFILPQSDNENGAVVAVDLLEYDRQVWQHELELLSRLLDAAVGEDHRALSSMSQEFHSINVYDSLQDMQLQFKKERDRSIDDGDGGDDQVVEQLVARIRCM